MGLVAVLCVALFAATITPTCVISSVGPMNSTMNIAYAGVVFFFACIPRAIIRGAGEPTTPTSCSVCNYDMAGLADACVCPECGSHFDRTKVARRETICFNPKIGSVVLLSTLFLIIGMVMFRAMTTEQFAASIITSKQALARWDNAMWLDMEELAVILVLLAEGYALVGWAGRGRFVGALVAAPVSLALLAAWIVALDHHIARLLVLRPIPEHIRPLMFVLLMIVPLGGMWAGARIERLLSRIA